MSERVCVRDVCLFVCLLLFGLFDCLFVFCCCSLCCVMLCCCVVLCHVVYVAVCAVVFLVMCVFTTRIREVCRHNGEMPRQRTANVFDNVRCLPRVRLAIDATH